MHTESCALTNLSLCMYMRKYATEKVLPLHVRHYAPFNSRDSALNTRQSNVSTCKLLLTLGSEIIKYLIVNNGIALTMCDIKVARREIFYPKGREVNTLSTWKKLLRRSFTSPTLTLERDKSITARIYTSTQFYSCFVRILQSAHRNQQILIWERRNMTTR